MNLKDWRTEEKISMQGLADKIGLQSGASIFHYERGKIPKLKIALLIKKVSKNKVTAYNKLIAAYEKLKPKEEL